MTPLPIVLFALSETDRRRFLPDGEFVRKYASGARWIDVTGMQADAWHRLLTETAPEVLVSAWDTPQFPEVLARQPDLPLRYVCHLTGGVRFLPRMLLERGLLVSNWGDCASRTVAEHAVLLTLAALRSLPRWRPMMMQMPSDRYAELRTRSLHGKRVGLHGFGRVARQITRLLEPFGTEVRAYSAGVPEEFYARHGVRSAGSLEELFSDSQILIECEALTPHTKGSVTQAVLELLPDEAVFVNVGRGQVVDESSLIRRAKQGKVYLALDVFAQEPLDPGSELFRLSDAILSPHIAGPTFDGFAACGEFALKNIDRYFRGEEIEGRVTLEDYDRAS